MPYRERVWKCPGKIVTLPMADTPRHRTVIRIRPYMGGCHRAPPRGPAVRPRAGCGCTPSWRRPTARPLRPFSRHIRPTRSEPSQWKGNAMPPELVAARRRDRRWPCSGRSRRPGHGRACSEPTAARGASRCPSRGPPSRAWVYAPTVDAAQANEAATVDEVVLDAPQPVLQVVGSGKSSLAELEHVIGRARGA